MIATTALAKEYGARTLFSGVSLQLNAGSRYGLVGANGSGKSTFLRLLAGDEEASEGTVTLVKRARVGVLRQDRFLDDGAIILDLAMRGDAVVWNALAEQRRIADSGDHAEAARMADLEDQIAAHDGYTLEARAAAVLEGLGIPTAVHHAPLGTLSGGFKLRVLLAQVLVGGADVLLLDEPTNHLDILTIRWLEKFLADYAGCAVIISHDQRFLDNVTTHTLDVDYGTITLYTGGYSKAMVEKAAARARKETAVDARRGRDRPQARLRRALRRQEHQGHPGPEPPQADRAHRGRGAGGQLAARPGAALRARAPERPRGAGAGRRQQVVRRQARARERVAGRAPRRAGRHHRPQRPRQIDAAEDRRGAPGGRRRSRPLGPRGAPRLLPPGPPRGADRRRGHAALDPRRGVPGREPHLRARPARARAVLGRETGKKVRPAVGRRVRAPDLRAARRSRSRTCSCSTSRPTTSISRPSTPSSRRSSNTRGR